MKLISVVGARPQFVKAAMIVRAVNQHNKGASRQRRIRHRLIHTGQHYEHAMSGVFFEELQIPRADFDLGVGSGSHGAQTGAMLEALEKVLLREKPDVVLTYGDTNSTIAGALAAVKLHIPVAHLEAGLRSFNRRMAEEHNRVASDHLCDILFCPTKTAVHNLRKEGLTRNVYMTGDVMLDAVFAYRRSALARKPLLDSLSVSAKQYALATIHRAETTDSPALLANILETLASLNYPIIFPVHPRVRERLRQSPELRETAKRLKRSMHLRMTEPMSYLDMLSLELNARLILTDSGGVQKEAYFAGVPCLTIREETEWVETLKGGWNRIIGTSPMKITAIFESLRNQNGASPQGRPDWKSFGDGKAAERTIGVLLKGAPIRSVH